jgi:transcription-repair coupling factor (superfamily II helicase)
MAGILESGFPLRRHPGGKRPRPWGPHRHLLSHAAAHPPPGQRFTLPRPTGSADALLLARLAQRERAAGRITAIVTADAADAQRLIDEMAFFAPELRCALFRLGNPALRQLLAAPGPDQRAPGHAVAHPSATRGRRRGAGARHHGAVPAGPPSFLAGYTFHFKQGQKLDEAKLKAQLTLAGYQHVSQVVSHGEYAVRGGLIDLFPMGSPCPTGWTCSTTRSTPSAPSTPTASAASTPCPRCACCPAASSPWTRRRAPSSAALARAAGGRPTRSRIYKDMGNGVATAGIEYYLPLFFDETATVFDYLGDDATWCCTAIWSRPSSASGRHRSATAWCRATPSARPCRPRRCS